MGAADRAAKVIALDIARAVINRRTKIGSSQAMVAVLSGVGLNTVQRIEAGATGTNLVVLTKVLRTLGLKLIIKRGHQ